MLNNSNYVGIDFDNCTKQEFLFYNWRSCCYKLEKLNFAVQNDMQRLLSDEVITKEQILAAKAEFDRLYDQNIKELSELKIKIDNFLTQMSL